jgi:hypothetical protein
MSILLLIILILKLFDFNPLDFFSLSIDEKVSLDDNRKTQVVKAFHENVRRQIQKEKEKE